MVAFLLLFHSKNLLFLRWHLKPNSVVNSNHIAIVDTIRALISIIIAILLIAIIK
jgi:hypothetical protein